MDSFYSYTNFQKIIKTGQTIFISRKMSQSNSSISFQPIDASSLEQLYQPIEQIGRGSFAEVIKARQIKGNNIRAIKRIQLNPLLQEVNKQVARLKLLKADHIIQFYGYINAQDSNELNIIMHLCKGSLRDQLKRKKKFNFDQIISLITQITSAMLVLSQKFTMHLDLKPQNILYEQENYYKICDFGCSQFFYNLSKYSKLGNFSKKVSNLQYQIKDCLFGTPQYIAPQIQLGILKVGTNSCDVWSFGVILYEIIYGKYPFKLQQNGRVKNSQFVKFVKKQIQIKYDTTTQNYPIELIKQMLRPNPTQRIKWRQIKQKLIKQYGCHQSQFVDLQKAADSQIKMSSIYGEIIMLIQNNTGSQNLTGIWQKYKTQLLQIKYTLILLGYCQLQKFFKSFSYKIQHKLNKTSLTNINFLFENLREQVYTLYQANTQLDIYTDIQLQQMLRQKLRQLQQQTKQINVPDGDFEKIKIFIHEVLNSSNLFCNEVKFRKSCEVLNITQIQ